MKRMLWLVNLLLVLLFASSAMAGYTVKPGNTLWGIAKKYGVGAKEIQALNPRIKSPKYIIQIGWVLEIPTKKEGGKDSLKKVALEKNQAVKKAVSKMKTAAVVLKKAELEKGKANFPSSRYIVLKKDWIYPGGNMYRGKLAQDLPVLGYDAKAQTGLLKSVQEGKSIWANVQPKSEGGLVLAEDGSIYKMVKMLSGGEGKKPVQILTGFNNEQLFLNDRFDPSHSEMGKIYHFGDDYLLLPIICDNPTLIVMVSGPPKITQPPPLTVKNDAPPPGINMIIPPIAKAPPEKWSKSGPDNWDWYVGPGNYRSRIAGNDNHGYYGWTKFRYRPLWYKPEENSLGIKHVGFGFVGFLSGGEGIAARHYDYKWREAAAGVTTKVYAKNSDYDFDAMIGRLWNDGTWMGSGGNKQVDDFILLSAHGNFYRELEDLKDKWLKKFEVNVEGRFPFSTKVKRGEKTNNKVIEANYVQWIYEFNLGENNSLNLSPGFNFGGGYEWSADDETFVKIGPAFELSSYNNVIAGVSVLNYKFQDKGQWHPISGYISIDGSWRAYEASQITSVSEEELRGLENGSKLLANPADYL
ncbi:MAG: hypothetical protein ACD_7C00090G0002 [uncultured bacterium]|nr:MAG: hypothetical protein ACD_7C00090G0002 [uncultured bacterium]HBR79540.1 hypothetical protein [Candidatus Moranbacteria bacterium]